MDVVDSSLPGCYLLVVVGEPYTEDHKRQILQKISKGLLSWDVEVIGCDLSELENVCSQVKSVSEAETELLLQHSTDTLAVEVLFNAQVSTLKQCLKNLLLATTGHKHLIYAGYSFAGTGGWIMQNGVFRFSDFVDAFQDAEVQKELQNHVGCTFHVHCTQEGEWTSTNLEKQAIRKLVKIILNPPDKVDSLPGSQALIQCLDSALITHTLEEMMTLSPLVGNIRFNRPTLYVFPGGQGDCALFGINGFNMLIDGGFNRKPCFWEFIRHLDRLDAVMVTRLCESNVCGITTMMKRKAINNIYPQIGYVFCNVEGKTTPNDEISKDKDDLLVSVLSEGHAFLNNLMELKMKPHRCFRDATNTEPFTLYQKVGHGTLEMYTLSPQKDSKEVKEFLQQWASKKETFSRVKTGVKFQDNEISIPLSHALSICSLIVWRPANPQDSITRIFFPGSAPQNRIFEGLEKLKSLDVLKKRICTQSSIHSISVEKPKSKSISKSMLTKHNVITSPVVTNGTGKSPESVISKKETPELQQKKELPEKRVPKAPIKKEITKSPPELKEKREVKKVTATPPTLVKKDIKERKTSASLKPTEAKKTTSPPKSTEIKTKGMKEVTNKNTVETKAAAKRKVETPKPKPPTKPTTKATKPSVPSPKHTKPTAIKKITSKTTAVVSTLVSEKKVEPSTENKEKAINQIKPDIQSEEFKEETKSEICNDLTEKSSLSLDEVNKVHEIIDEVKIESTEDKSKEMSHVLNEKIESEPIKQDDSEIVSTILDNKNVIDTNVSMKMQSTTDMLLANASMEGSFCEGLMDVEEEIKADTFLQNNNILKSPSNEIETKIITEDEIIEEKSEKESLHDVMALENNEETNENIQSTHSFRDEYPEKYTFEQQNIIVEQENIEITHNIEKNIDEEIPVESKHLSVNIISYNNDDDEDIVKSPTPVAVVDYEDEGVAFDSGEKYETDIPENRKLDKDEDFDKYQEKFEDDVLEMDKSEEKETSSISEEEKLEEEMIRHPTPPGERNFYEKIGVTADEQTHMEELDTKFMEHYLPVTRPVGENCQPLYEEAEDEESDSESPVVEQPVYGNVVQADFPEFVNISGGTTPSEPQSPKSMYDSKHRLPDVSEQLFSGTPPQEIDEDRFEEEQKIKPDDIFLQTSSQEKEQIAYFNELKQTEQIVSDENNILQTNEQAFYDKDNISKTNEQDLLDEGTILNEKTEQEQDSMLDKSNIITDQESLLNNEGSILNEQDSGFQDNKSILQMTDNTRQSDYIREHETTFHDEDSAFKDQESPLQENDSIFTYQENEIQENESVLKDNENYSVKSENVLKADSHLDYETNDLIDQQQIFQQKDSASNAETPEISLEEQNKFMEQYKSLPVTSQDITNTNIQSDDDSDVQEQDDRLFQDKTKDFVRHSELVTSGNDMFSTHPMDQSFHESYIETTESQENVEMCLEDKKFVNEEDSYHTSYIIDKELNRLSPSDSEDEKVENTLQTKFNEEDITSHDIKDYSKMTEEVHDDTFQSNYFQKDQKYFADTEEGYFADNERSYFGNDSSTRVTSYSYQSNISSNETENVSTEKKEIMYSSTTNGVNGHQLNNWRGDLLNYESSDNVSFHNENHSKETAHFYQSSQEYRDQDLFEKDGHKIPSESFNSRYTDLANVDDIYLEHKEQTKDNLKEKETFSSMSYCYNNKDYHQEDKDDLQAQYSEHVSGIYEVQKDSSTGFRLEDWSKPLGLPSPPEIKTQTKSSKLIAANKTTKTEKKPKVENVKTASMRTEKTSKTKSNSTTISPVYVDLAYVPHHGDPHYSNIEFFQRIRARYYVFSGINPSKEVLNALLEAKKSWKDDSEVTIIPTYETDTLGYWMALNQDTLIENKIDVAPSASRCTVNLQDHDTSCAAYRLEF